MSDAQHKPVAAGDRTRRSLIELKRGITELKLEALRRGYGIEPGPPGAIDDLDVIANEAARNIEQHRLNSGQGRDRCPPRDRTSTPSRA